MLSFSAARVTLLALTLSAATAHAQSTPETIDLSPKFEAPALTQVSIELDAGGYDVVRADRGLTTPSNSPTDAAAAEQKLPMSVSAKLQYDECRLADQAPNGDDATSPLAVRHYDKADAVLKVDAAGLAPRLTDKHRIIVVGAGAARPTLYSLAGPMTRRELDLIDVIGNSCLVDRLLPTNAVAKGDTWNHDPAVIGGLLGLDTVAVCEVQSVLDDFNSSFAKIRLAGVVHGVADGAATQQEIRGVYLFDRKLQRISRFNLAVRETRSIGGATPGLQGVAKLQINIQPISSSPALTDAVVAAAKSSTAPSRSLLYHSPSLGFQVAHDRQWFITSEGREQVAMRRIDASDVVTHCTISVLPPKSAGRQASLDEFQKHISHSLGKNLGQIVSSREWANAHQHRCFEVVARGAVEEMPVEWHYYLVAPESGHRVSLAFAIEGEKVDRLARADRELVEQIQLIPQQTTSPQTALRQPESIGK